jgi:hypothetical protein
MRVARDRPLETRMDRGFRNVLNRIKNKGTPDDQIVSPADSQDGAHVVESLAPMW